jgi:hypothetical protein
MLQGHLVQNSVEQPLATNTAISAEDSPLHCIGLDVSVRSSAFISTEYNESLTPCCKYFVYYILYTYSTVYIMGARGSLVIKTLGYKSEDRGFEIR